MPSDAMGLACIPIAIPSLSDTVPRIVGVSPQKQVICIDTARHVALVKNILSLWDRTIGHFPS